MNHLTLQSESVAKHEPVLALQLQVTRLTSGDQLQAVMPQWNRIAGDVPFRRWEWLEGGWRHYSTARGQLYVLAVTNRHGHCASYRGADNCYVLDLPESGDAYVGKLAKLRRNKVRKLHRREFDSGN